MIIQLAIKTPAFLRGEAHDPAETVYPGLLQTFPKSFSENRDLVVTVMLSYVEVPRCFVNPNRSPHGEFRNGVKLRRTQCEQMSSQLPLKADIAQCGRHFAFVP
jgi:hypothetical protein